MILADISGIQDFVFHVPREEGGQARMLRARSFYIQLFTECTARLVMNAINANNEDLIFCAAGKFLILPSQIDVDEENLKSCRQNIEQWLLKETHGLIRFSIDWDQNNEDPSFLDIYNKVQHKLQLQKLQSWKNTMTKDTIWDSGKLCLDVYSHEVQRKNERFFKDLGAQLASNSFDVLVVPKAQPDQQDNTGAFDLRNVHQSFLKLNDSSNPKNEKIFAVLPLKQKSEISGELNRHFGRAKLIDRNLLRHVPERTFEELAEEAKGARYLGVLKMDADSLGDTIHKRLQINDPKEELRKLSQQLDRFFVDQLDALIRERFNLVYSVFSGGDDLLVVAPWDIAFDFAGEVQKAFMKEFGGEGMTISAGMAIVRYHYPIRFAADQAENLLENAKREKTIQAEPPKDQLVCLGQGWKWKHHPEIAKACKQLTQWVNDGIIQRGWLTTLLELAELRTKDPNGSNTRIHPALAASRLAYHVARNWSSPNHGDKDRRDSRLWMDEITKHFDGNEAEEKNHIQTLYLPAIVRFAMLATRSKGD